LVSFQLFRGHIVRVLDGVLDATRQVTRGYHHQAAVLLVEQLAEVPGLSEIQQPGRWRQVILRG